MIEDKFSFLNKYPTIKTVLVVFTMLSILAGGLSAMNQLRWWAWRTEVIAIGTVAYSARITQLSESKSIITEQILGTPDPLKKSKLSRLQDYLSNEIARLQREKKDMAKW